MNERATATADFTNHEQTCYTQRLKELNYLNETNNQSLKAFNKNDYLVLNH